MSDAAKATSGVDLLASMIDSAVCKLAEDINADLLKEAAVYVSLIKIKKSKWGLSVVVKGKVVHRLTKTWRTRREALLASVLVEIGAAATYSALTPTPDPFAGMEQATYSKPITYKTKDKR